MMTFSGKYSSLVVTIALLLAAAGLRAQNSTGPVRNYPATGDLTITLHDEIESPIYSWPRTLLTYAVDFSARRCTAQQLHLLGASAEEIPFQLSSVHQASDGHLLSADINFFSDLPPGATRTFKLTVGSLREEDGAAGVSEKRDGTSIEVNAGSLQLRLPASQSVPEKDPLPAPLLALNQGQGWIGHNTLLPGDAAKGTPITITTRTVEAGPLFRTYEVAYHFANDATYTATLRIVAGYPFILFSERMEKITPEMNMALNMYWEGFRPTKRFAANGWLQPHGYIGIEEPITTPGIIEEPHWFPADSVEDPGKEMIFHLAAFEGNAPRDAVPAMSFWSDGASGQELSVFVPDTAKWSDGQYMIWQPSTLLQVSFRYGNGHLVWHWPLVSGTRETSIALTPTAAGEDTLQAMRSTYTAEGKGYSHAFEGNGAFSHSSLYARYAGWMRAWYGSLDLNRVKDWVLTYPASAKQAPAPLFSDDAKTVDLSTRAARFENMVRHSILMDYPLGSDLGIMNISHRPIRPIVQEYMTVRSALTPEQKKHVDALLLLSAYINAGDDIAPSRACLSGTANMSADGFTVPSEIGILFPEHPMGPEWREQFGKIMQLHSTFYTRPEVPAYHSLGGRWAESLATYNWADLGPVLTAQTALSHTDGINRIASDAMAQRANWMVDELSAPIYNPDPYWRQEEDPTAPPASPWKAGLALTPSNGFERQYPSHGAHGSGTGIVVPYDVPILAKYLRNYDPLASEHLLWAYAQRTSLKQSEGDEMYWRAGVLDEMKGNTGTNPHLQSAKYTGHGIILRAGVDTPNEVSLHLDQVDQGPNYRWGDNGEGSSGVLYFYANGRPWTGHERENTGDHTNDDATGNTNFAVLHDHAWRSIGENVLDRPLHDLGMVQFGEIGARKDLNPYSWPGYRSRSTMLVGTDYVILADDADGETRFSWFTARDLPYPKIVFLEPLTARSDHWTEVSTAMSKGFLRDAAGPSIVLFTHKKDEVEMEHMTSKSIPSLHDAPVLQYAWAKKEAPATPGVFFVKTSMSHDRVFRSFSTIHYTNGDERFTGEAGVIRSMSDGSTQLALVEGSIIEAGGIHLELPATALENTAISAAISGSGEVNGVFSNMGTAPVMLTLAAPAAKAAGFYIDGHAAVETKTEDARQIELPLGRHIWQLTTHLPTPLPPTTERTVNRTGGAQVYFNTVDGADRYRLELSADGGSHWQRAVEGAGSPLTIAGMKNGIKIHVRIVAMNREHESSPRDEYPVYITSAAPAPPDGLDLQLAKNAVSLHWGEVLGAGGYRIYRRKVGEARWTKIYSGLANTYIDKAAQGVIPAAQFPGAAANAISPVTQSTLYEYAVTAFNDNGEGIRSASANSDPTSWSNWWPAGQDHTFKRQTGFWLPPYVPKLTVPPLHYPPYSFE